MVRPRNTLFAQPTGLEAGRFENLNYRWRLEVVGPIVLVGARQGHEQRRDCMAVTGVGILKEEPARIRFLGGKPRGGRSEIAISPQVRLVGGFADDKDVGFTPLALGRLNLHARRGVLPQCDEHVEFSGFGPELLNGRRENADHAVGPVGGKRHGKCQTGQQSQPSKRDRGAWRGPGHAARDRPRKQWRDEADEQLMAGKTGIHKPDHLEQVGLVDRTDLIEVEHGGAAFECDARPVPIEENQAEGGKRQVGRCGDKTGKRQARDPVQTSDKAARGLDNQQHRQGKQAFVQIFGSRHGDQQHLQIGIVKDEERDTTCHQQLPAIACRLLGPEHGHELQKTQDDH